MDQAGAGVDQLEQWLAVYDANHPCWEGCNLAAGRIADQRLIDWLVEHGHSDAASRRRWLERCLYRFDLATVMPVLGGGGELSPWDRQLQQRLLDLGVMIEGDQR